jgi:hypothetical protein
MIRERGDGGRLNSRYRAEYRIEVFALVQVDAQRVDSGNADHGAVERGHLPLELVEHALHDLMPFSPSPWIAELSESIFPVCRLSGVPRATRMGMCSGLPPLSSLTRR